MCVCVNGFSVVMIWKHDMHRGTVILSLFVAIYRMWLDWYNRRMQIMCVMAKYYTLQLQKLWRSAAEKAARVLTIDACVAFDPMTWPRFSLMNVRCSFLVIQELRIFVTFQVKCFRWSYGWCVTHVLMTAPKLHCEDLYFVDWPMTAIKSSLIVSSV